MRSLRILLAVTMMVAVPVYAAAPAEQPKKIVDAPKTPVKPLVETPTPAATVVVEHTPVTTTVAHTAPEVTNEEVLAAAFKTVEEARVYFDQRNSDTKKAFAWAGILAAVLNLLLALVSRLSPFWQKTRGKWVIRFVTLTLGVAAGVVGNMALGMPWWDALVMFMSGPGAVLLHEYRKMIPFLRPKKE